MASIQILRIKFWVAPRRRQIRMRAVKKCRKRFDLGEDEEDDGDVDSVLQISNSVYFYGSVEQKSVLKLWKALDGASREAVEKTYWPSEARVYLYIQSPGGEAFVGLSAMDHIRTNRVPVIAIADGYVASAATFMLLGAQERKALQNAKILRHQLTTGFWGKYADRLDEVQNSRELMESIKNVYKDNTKMKDKELDRLLSKELHMNATQALHSGIIDEIW